MSFTIDELLSSKAEQSRIISELRARVAELEGQLESSRRDWKSCADSAIRRCDKAEARVAELESDLTQTSLDAGAKIMRMETRVAELEEKVGDLEFQLTEAKASDEARARDLEAAYARFEELGIPRYSNAPVQRGEGES